MNPITVRVTKPSGILLAEQRFSPADAVALQVDDDGRLWLTDQPIIPPFTIHVIRAPQA